MNAPFTNLLTSLFFWDRSALFFLGIMIIPAIATVAIQVSDYFYPQSAQERRVRERLVACYTVAAPDKLNSVDSILAKYKGKEYRLLAQLGEKYPKFSQCGGGR